MRFSEVQKAVLEWPPDKQDRLAAYLTTVRLRRDPEYMAEIDRRLQDTDPANWMTLDELNARLKDT